MLKTGKQTENAKGKTERERERCGGKQRRKLSRGDVYPFGFANGETRWTTTRNRGHCDRRGERGNRDGDGQRTSVGGSGSSERGLASS